LKNRFLFLILTLFILLSIVNTYIFVNRTNGFNYIESADYSHLYNLDSQKKLTKINVVNDSAVFELTPQSEFSEWQVFEDSVFKYKCFGKNPKIKILDNTHEYKIVNIKSDFTIQATIDYSANSSEYPAKKNLYLVKCNIPITDKGFYNISKWIYFSKLTTSAETDKINEILKDSIKLDSNSQTLKKVEKICCFLLQKLSAKAGIPDSTLKTKSPYCQYLEACSNKSKLWCENYTQIYLAFANAANIPSRYVATNVRIGNTNLGGHVFAESYIKEQNKWAYIDLSSSKIFIFGKDNLVINSVDLISLSSLNVSSDLKSRVYSNGVILTKDFDSVNKTERFYFNHNPELIFLLSEQSSNTFVEKFVNYIYPKSYYVVYAGNTAHSNLLFHIKLLFVYCWFAVAFILFLLVIVEIRKYILLKK
jgi:hypothetical protein